MTSERSLSQVLLQRINRDYEDQPGLRLTPLQAHRLWGLDGPTCGAMLWWTPGCFSARRTGNSCARDRPRDDRDIQAVPAALRLSGLRPANPRTDSIDDRGAFASQARVRRHLCAHVRTGIALACAYREALDVLID